MKQSTRVSWILCAGVAVISGCATQSSTAPTTGWQSLVKGTVGLDNFNRLGTANWSAEDGAIQASAGGKDPAYLVSKATYGDFSITAEFWASDDANSGIFIRCADPNKMGSDTCYEVNIYDRRPDPTYGTGAIVNVAKVVPMPKAGGQWNTMEITATGPHLVVIFNGQKTVDAQDAKLASGPFALQWGSGVIRFRSVQIRTGQN
jgi:hypothetical protein